MQKPRIALLVPDTLAAIGLRSILQRIMPGAEVCIFVSLEELMANDLAYFHYFTTAQMFLAHASFFLARHGKTIVLIQGDEAGLLLQGVHTLNVRQREDDLVRAFLRLAQSSHAARGVHPSVVQQAQMPHKSLSALTPREHEVLHGITTGLLNKEIAEKLGVSLATIISHRKNITLKLGTKSVSALTIYAVTHGIVAPEEI